MEFVNKKLTATAPGRVCLFGEHQDYLGLPVIACAITKRISVSGSRDPSSMIRIDLPDISSVESFPVDNITYTNSRDYLKSSVNILKRNGFTFSNGIDAAVRSEIPINAGASSSSAMVVAWINFLARISDQSKSLSKEEIAEFAHQAEVLEFGEPGGMMDHFTTAIGEIIFLKFNPELKIEKLGSELGAIIIGNSGEPKDTKTILSRVKLGVLDIIRLLSEKIPSFSLHSSKLSELKNFENYLLPGQLALLEGTIINRDITAAARMEFLKTQINDREIGRLLNNHQTVLRDVLKISTPKIDSMIDAALDAGALGAKINGSGGGGTMFAYSPENPEKVLAALSKIAAQAFIVFPDEGTKIE